MWHVASLASIKWCHLSPNTVMSHVTNVSPLHISSYHKMNDTGILLKFKKINAFNLIGFVAGKWKEKWVGSLSKWITCIYDWKRRKERWASWVRDAFCKVWCLIPRGWFECFFIPSISHFSLMRFFPILLKAIIMFFIVLTRFTLITNT